MKKIIQIGTLPVLIILCVIIFCTCMTWGNYAISMEDFFAVLRSHFMDVPVTWDKNTEIAINVVRFPRMCAAFLVGAALTVSGATYQGIFQNPLVSPDLLGVSAGACVGASLGILGAYDTLTVQLMALVGGLLAVVFTVMIPKLLRNSSNLMLVLSGIIVGGFFGSMQGLLKYIADPDTQLALITYWTMGSLAKIKIDYLISAAPVMIACIVILVVLSWRINLLSLGEFEAKTLGVNVPLLRNTSIIAATLLTACSICLAGTVGWVGLVLPHLGRLLVGSDNRKLIPASIFLGGGFMMLVDSIARNITDSDLPLSILTGFIGAPLYAWLLYKQKAKV